MSNVVVISPYVEETPITVEEVQDATEGSPYILMESEIDTSSLPIFT